MFNYSRYLFPLSVIIGLVTAYLFGGFVGSIAENNLKEITVANNTTLAQGYINSTWRKYNPIIKKLTKINSSKWNNYRQFKQFSKETMYFFNKTDISAPALYSANGYLLISPANYKKNNKISQIIKNIKNNKIISQIITNNDGNKFIQTAIAIFADSHKSTKTSSNKIEAILLFNKNITKQLNEINFLHILTTGVITLILLIFSLIAIIRSRKSENIIAQQHEVNEDLIALAKNAEAESKNKSQFLANISHELRTPLNAIIGFSEILKIETKDILSPLHADHIEDIYSSGEHLLSLINDILDYSKAEAGKLELNLTEIDGVKLAKNSMRLVIPRAEEAQITLIENTPDKHLVLKTDAKKLKQVLLNLLSNSVKFTPAGGEVKISLWHDLIDDMVIFEVSDTGIGISPKDISKVLSPFGQVDSKLSRRFEGTGLGLPLSKKLVEIMGGKFSIKSEEGEGTIVTISIPRVNLEEEDEIIVKTPNSAINEVKSEKANETSNNAFNEDDSAEDINENYIESNIVNEDNIAENELPDNKHNNNEDNINKKSTARERLMRGIEHLPNPEELLEEYKE